MGGDLENIWQFINRNHVLSMTAAHNDQLWSANAFYATLQQENALIILSSTNTEHGQMLSQSPIISGTVSSQTVDIPRLQGLQYSAKAIIIATSDPLYQPYLTIYQERFPIAKSHIETLWKISFLRLKLTDNSLGFGTKINWEKS